MEESAIEIKSVYKDFKLPHQKISTVKGFFTNLFALGNNTYEVQHALKGIDITVGKGEFFGIVGRNGSGKSTLLKIIAGIYQPTKGSIQVNGRLVPFIELGVGFNPELTGRENVYLNGALLGFSQSQVRQKYDGIVEFAELERFMDQKLKNYSSGMQVRLAFSVATRLAESDILLIDEVLAVGDASFQRKCFNHFRELKKQKKTVIFVSHDMSAIREYCDRAAMINDSEVVRIGTPDEIAQEYVKLFNSATDATAEDENNRGKRWGDKKVVIKKLNAVVKNNELTITADLHCHDKSDNPVFGYMIKDAAGHELIGSNTKLALVKTGIFKPQENYQIVWKIPQIFNDGTFYLTCAVSHRDGVTQHEWWEDALHFTITREDKTPYAINPKGIVTVKKK